MWEVMLSGQGARRNPLTVALTTAGYDRKSVCWEVWKYAEGVASGAIKDDSFLPMIFAAPVEADWKDEKVWAAANPNLGVSVKLDFLRSECARAIEMPTYENTFRQLYLDQWTEQDQRWRMIHLALWQELGRAELELREYERSSIERSWILGGFEVIKNFMRKRNACGILLSIFIFFERILELVAEVFLDIARKRVNPFCGREFRALGANAPSADVAFANDPY
jgi:hypothetical protein